MADRDRPDRPDRRGLDVLALVAGVAALLVAGYVLAGGPTVIGGADAAWLAVAGATVAGLVVLLVSWARGR